jgi:hypothetical protein
MLERIGQSPPEELTSVRARDAAFPSPFKSVLEYASPARGTWNIVHTGMLIPQSHQVFICADGCLRGVVLTAAEMGTIDRFSSVAIREDNVLRGDMEELIIDGTADIIGKLPYKPRAVLIYTSCIHHFMACDLPRVYRILRERFPDIEFVECYMNPIMRKSGLTPDQLMRRQLYAPLKPRPIDGRAVNIVGNDLVTDDSSELVRMIKENGFKLREITRLKTYDEYQEMAEAFLNISTFPAARAGGDALSQRLGQKHLYLPFAFDYSEVEDEYAALAAALGCACPDFGPRRAEAEEAIQRARAAVGGMSVAIDYTAVSRPVQLAKFLTQHGFTVTDIFLDAVPGDDKPSFDWAKEHLPELKFHPTVHPAMRVRPRGGEETFLAIGQKAAYFTGTDRFVNMVEDGGHHGFDGIAKLAELIEDAAKVPKDARSLIQMKGLGCGGGCCG